MSDPNRTAIMLLIDRSGSMSSIRHAAQNGLQEFIEGQAAESKATGQRRTLCISQFDNVYESVHGSLPVAEVPTYELQPRGSTALLDAMARSIDEFGAELAAMPEAERPGQVIYAVLTDGLENSSQEFDWPAVRDRVNQQRDVYKWTVLYLGAHEDAIAVGEKLGVPDRQVLQYSATNAGSRAAYTSLSGVVAVAAAGGPAEFDEIDRAFAMGDQSGDVG